MYAVNGISCQDCHMVDINTFRRSADTFQKPERREYHHYFNGANFMMYFLGVLKAKKEGNAELAANLQHKYEMAVLRLQYAAELEVSPVYNNDTGKLTQVKVRVYNRRAGHNLPTSLNARQMWLEVMITDASGKIIKKSGFMDDKGTLDTNTRIFNSIGMDVDMHHANNFWDIIYFTRINNILPKGYRDVYYTIFGNQLEQEIKVKVKLRFRQFDQGAAERLLTHLPKGVNLMELYGLREIPAVPVVDMVDKNMTFSAFKPSNIAEVIDKAVSLEKNILAHDGINPVVN